MSSNVRCRTACFMSETDVTIIKMFNLFAPIYDTHGFVQVRWPFSDNTVSKGKPQMVMPGLTSQCCILLTN